MTSIWSFLLQTLTVSLVALLLLVLKAIFRDKLSPRWQYGVWVLLAARCLLPAGLAGQGLLPLNGWVEMAKTWAESGLSSAYSGPWTAVTVTSPLPWVVSAPRSVTDWLFVVYCGGILFWLVWFLAGYLRLRRSLTVLPEGDEQVARVARRYGLPLPRVARAPVASAFVCGPLRPVLVLPEGREVDDKVILHELIHLKYGDLWLNLLCCLLRCLHWCNPFLWWVFLRVGNDAEALCDQRVLERLEGEERRDYGRILLSMADDRYARQPGTTSMANGGRNIKSRIQSIARFKRYPRGMALVSLCIVAILAPTCLAGSAQASALPAVSDHEARGQLTEDELRTALLRGFAAARSARPSTPAGALDCYAKAVVNNNGYFLAAVSDTGTQRELYETLLERNDDTWEWGNFYLDLGLFPADDPDLTWEERRWSADNLPPYLVMNLTETEEGYSALVVFFYMRVDAESHPHDCYLIHEVALTHDEGGWLVEKMGEREPSLTSALRLLRTVDEYGYLPGLDLAVIPFASQGQFSSSLHIQRQDQFSDETLFLQPSDHSFMICGFGNNLTVSPDLDARFDTTWFNSCLEVRYEGGSLPDEAESFPTGAVALYIGDSCIRSWDSDPFLPAPAEPGETVCLHALGPLRWGGELVDRIQFSCNLYTVGEDGRVALTRLPTQTESLDLTEVIP